MKYALSVLIILLSFVSPAFADDDIPQILPLKDRAEVINNWLGIRLETVVPELMHREGIDMWVLIAREYNDDPVMKTMLPSWWRTARRRTILVFFDRGGEAGVERLAVARYNIGDYFEGAWDPAEQPDQWRRLAGIIEERNPQKIALNTSSTFGLADGLTHSEYEGFVANLPENLHSRIVSGERLAVGWLETRIPEEMTVYPQIVRIAHRIIAEGLSDAAIQPGATTTEELQWWFEERIRSLKLTSWFHTSISFQRAEEPGEDENFALRRGRGIILPGDLLHIDLGITYLRLNTDTQEHAYVLKPGETDAPEGIKRALAIGNRLQDILTAEFQTGRTGNEILKAALDRAKAEGIKASIYTHPLGYHGHAAGPTIGLWDRQDGVPGQGDYPLFPDTAYAIELNATVSIPEWNNGEIRIMLEEDAIFDGEKVWYIDGRQKELILIPNAN